jgi:hypothetical protein
VKVALRSHANEKYVCADDATSPDRPLVANRSSINGWETFDLMVQAPDGSWVPYEQLVPPTPTPPPDETPTPPGAQDEAAFLRQVQVVGSNPNALWFAAPARMTSWMLANLGMTIHSTGTSGWYPVSIDGQAPSQSGTLWIFECIQGKWYATGCERLRPEQLTGTTKPASEASVVVGRDWLYDPSRWGIMAGYNPKP